MGVLIGCVNGVLIWSVGCVDRMGVLIGCVNRG